MTGEQRNGAEAGRIHGVRKGLLLVLFSTQEISAHVFGSSCVGPDRVRTFVMQ